MADPADFWATLYRSGTVSGLLLLGLIVNLLVLAAQLEALISACRRLLDHRRQLANAQRRVEAEIAAARASATALDEALPDLEQAVQELGREHEQIAAEAAEARKLHIREVVTTDVFVSPGDRPFLARVARPRPDPEEPLAESWTVGRDHILYAADPASATRRFAQRFPAERGFQVGPIAPFEIPWTPVAEAVPIEVAAE
jgi:hypothetical protein